MNAPSNSRRVGLRAVAAAANVCLQTASLALRNSPRLSAATRERVQAQANALGYRPDPEISRLMGRLRPSRKLQGSVVIAMLDLHRDARRILHPYDAGVRAGVTARADALGFGVSLFRLADYHGQMRQMLRVIHHRGITGVVLLPSTEPVALAADLGWEGLSVVSATSTVTSPHFHQVSPNHSQNIMALIDHLHQRGRRRITAIFNVSLDRRTHHAYSIALAWHGHRERILVIPDAADESTASAQVAGWIERHSPDVIIGGDFLTKLLHAKKLSRLCEGIEVVALTSHPGAPFAYLDQRPSVIGECAVSLLTGMMHNNETGIPAAPQTTTVRGLLCDPAEQRKRKPTR